MKLPPLILASSALFAFTSIGQVFENPGIPGGAPVAAPAANDSSTGQSSEPTKQKGSVPSGDSPTLNSADKGRIKENFNRPPIISLEKPAPIPTPPPIPTPKPIPTPAAFMLSQAVWLDIHEVGTASGRSQKIAVQFGTVGKGVVNATMEAVFLGNQSAVAARRQKIQLRPGALPKQIDGPEFNYVTLGSQYKPGQKNAGWMVRIVGQDGKVLAVKASDGVLEERAKDEQKWRTLCENVNWD